MEKEAEEALRLLATKAKRPDVVLKFGRVLHAMYDDMEAVEEVSEETQRQIAVETFWFLVKLDRLFGHCVS